jgi:ATP-dependent Lon protease
MADFCTYIFKRGKKRGTICKETRFLNHIFCKKHISSNRNNISDTNDTNDTNDKCTYSYKNQGTLPYSKDILPYIDSVNKGTSTDFIDILQDTSTDTIDKKKASTSMSTNIIDEERVKAIPIIQVYKKLQDDSIKNKIFTLQTSDQNKSVIYKHYTNMKRSDPNSTEYYKNQIFVDLALNYPWDRKYNINNIIKNKDISEFLNLLKSRLDNEIYGMESVKNEIMNVVCKFITNPDSNRNNIALHGPAGVGKSKFIKILSEILHIPLKTISLGGVKDPSFFLGHGYVYVESGPGKILQNVSDSNIQNPIMYFDELDKVSETDNGKDIFSFLCYLTDPTENDHFSDHYFYGMHFDLSKVFYVFTFNDINKIDKILLDRLNIIKVDCPTEDEIMTIVENHCIPEIIKNIGIKKNITFERANLKYIFNYCKSSIDKIVTSGIREYYRIIEKILLELNKDILININKYADDIIINNSLFSNLFEKIKHQINCYIPNTFISHMYI